MLKFLFGERGPKLVKETQREKYKRLVSELNQIIDTLPEKPRVTIDPATGHVLPEEPRQFSDEALALPKPTDQDRAAASGEPATAKMEPKVPAPRVPEKKVPKKRVPAPRVGQPRVGQTAEAATAKGAGSASDANMSG